MKKVPDLLPPSVQTLAQSYGNALGQSYTEEVVCMDFVLYSSPALIQGLLMTEVLEPGDEEVRRYFFGYKCRVCKTVSLVPSHVRSDRDLWESMRHKCDSSEIRRAVRNARDLARERGEYIVEGMNGKWWTERP
jgi:hypothetical protein